MHTKNQINIFKYLPEIETSLLFLFALSFNLSKIQ